MEIDERITRLKALVAADPEDALGHFLLGRELMAAGDWAAAAVALEECVRLNPRHTAAWRFLGDCQRQGGNNAAAAQTYRRGIAVAQETGELQAGREMEVFLKRIGEP